MSARSAPTAFVVDDEPTIGLVTAEILRRNGYNAYAFTNPVLALQRARTTPPALLICDVFMPGDMTGIDLAMEIKKLHPDTKVLIVSGLTEVDDLIDEAHRRGYFFSYVTKPIFPDALLKAIENIPL